MLCSLDALATGYGGADKQDKRNRGSHDKNSFAHSRRCRHPRSATCGGPDCSWPHQGWRGGDNFGYPFECCLKSGT